MDKMKKIKVGLYGGIGKVPLRAEVITCDHCESCDLYKKGYCLRVTAPFADTNCKYGVTSRVTGYTTRSYKYHEFESKWKADEAYGAKLDRPSSTVVAEIGDYVYLGISFVAVTEVKDSSPLYDHIIVGPGGTRYNLWQPLFGSRGGFVQKQDLEDLSNQGILYQLFKFVPRTFFENAKIESYKKETLPDFAMALKRGMPDLAKRFFEAWPEFDYSPNYIGKKAYISTLPKGLKIKDHNNNEFVIGDGEITCESYHSAFLPFNAKESSIKIKLNGSETYEIKSNDEVGPDTKIVGVD